MVDFRKPGTCALLWAEVRPEQRATHGRLYDHMVARSGHAEIDRLSWWRDSARNRDEQFYGHRSSRRYSGPDRCPAAIEWSDSGLFYPCGMQGHAAYRGYCWAHRGGRRGEPMTTRKRTITIDEEVRSDDPPRAEIRVSLGTLTVKNVLSAARKIEKAAGQANAPVDADVILDSFGGGGVEARIRWEMST